MPVGQPQLAHHFSEASEPVATDGQATQGRHPTWLTAPGVTLYWLAPAPVTGELDVQGAIREDHHIDTPDGAPAVRGRVKRVQVVERDFVRPGSQGPWVWAESPARLRDVATSPKWFALPSSDGSSTRVGETGLLVTLEVVSTEE